MSNAYEMCLRLLLYEAAGNISYCDAVYHSGVDALLKAYDSSLKHVIHIILRSLYNSLQDPLHDCVSADPQ